MQRKRLEYIDAMRGIAILFIVFGHIQTYCYGIASEHLPSFRALTSLLQLPMFFFVSGFVFNPQKMLMGGVKTLFSKFRQLVVPALFFGVIYVFINNIDIIYCLTDKFKCGYWFTLTLFEFIVVQYLWEYVAKKSNIYNNGNLYIILSIVIVSLFYVLSIPSVSEKFGNVSGISGLPMFRYYVYFVAGRLIHLYLDDLLHYKYRNFCVSFIVFGFLMLSVYNWCYNVNLVGSLFHVNLIIFELFALLSVFIFMYKKRSYLSSCSYGSRIITFIGRRTLDIYLLHYFFLPEDLSVFGHYFVNHPAPVLELVFGGMITFIIIVVCIIVSEMLRQSVFCKRWLLGVK